MRLRLVLAGVVGACLAGCASWERTRAEVVTPLNALVHRDYPRAFVQRDPDAVAGLFAPGGAAQAREVAGGLLQDLRQVDRARCLVLEMTEAADGAYDARCLLRLDGVDAQGARRTTSQEQRLTCARAGAGWRIEGLQALGPAEVLVAEGPTFQEEAGVRGLVFENHSRGVRDRAGRARIYHPGSGLSAADVDGDGLDDLLLVGGGDLRLFHNLGGHLRDESQARGIATPPRGECRAGFFGDIDGDGDVDLFVAMVDADDLLLLNRGQGHFEQVSARAAGITSSGQTTGACFADFDGDGDLDLYVVSGMSLLAAEPDPIYDAKNAAGNRYFRNRGDGTFEDRTEEAGVGDTGWGLACTTSDVDRDGDVDLLVANDFGRDVLYLNRGDGTFEDASDAVGLTYRTSSMSADFADLNADGLPDLLISGMASNSRWIVRMPGFPARGPFPLNILLRGTILDIMWEMLHGNRLYLSQADGTYREASDAAGIRDQEWGWGSVWLDYDNDGDLDAYGVNGFWSGDQPDDL